MCFGPKIIVSKMNLENIKAPVPAIKMAKVARIKCQRKSSR
jgi:hypothetical protein